MAHAVSRWIPTLLARLSGRSHSQTRAAISLQADAVVLAYQGPDHAYRCVKVPCTSLQQWPTLLAAMLREHQLTRCQLDLILCRPYYQLLQLDPPANIPPHEQASALLWTARDLLNESPESLVADILENPAQADRRVNLISASRELLRSLIAAVSPASVRCITIEEQVLRDLLPVSDEAQLLLTQTADQEPLLSIVRNGQLYVSRQLRGMGDLAQDPQPHRIDQLGLEMQRSMDYFQSQLRQKPISRILLGLPFGQPQAFESIQQQLQLLFATDIDSLLRVCGQRYELPDLEASHLVALGGYMASQEQTQELPAQQGAQS